MFPVPTIPALVAYTFAAFAFASLSLQAIRGFGTSCALSGKPATRRAEILGLSMLVITFFWFVTLLALTLFGLNPALELWPLQLVQLTILYQFPPLIMHMFYVEGCADDAGLRPGVWKANVVAGYVVAEAVLLLAFLRIFHIIDFPATGVGAVLGMFIGALFTWAAVFSTLVMSRVRRAKKAESVSERSVRRWMIGLFGLMIVVTALITLVHFARSGDGDRPHLLEFVASCMPMLFMFTAVYHEDRFQFFDLFIKRGLSLLFTILLLTGVFALLLPLLAGLELGPARPWVYAVLLVPFAMSIPWLHRKLGQLLDSVWLGRRFTTVEAVKHFLSGLPSATSERELAQRAEAGLKAIFHAPARIDLALREAPSADFDCARDLPIHSNGERVGVILMGHRANQTPYFSEDIALLGSLADVFSYTLANVRLQQKKQEQEQRARELSLHASRSELKALRAQINPHFLFNALNAIAGLIHKDPLRADRTVEQLAEVFRYTLRGSEKEWAILEDEMEFVEAYLDVERARFGQRLQVDVTVEPQVKPVKIPTMIVQTLVENAIKHGITSVRGPARIEIVARRSEDRLLIEVADNGSGFNETPAQATGSPKNGHGYGLKNVRQRFQGYFGDEAELTVRRDEVRGMTVVGVTMPLRRDAELTGPADAVEAAGSEGAA